MELLVEAEPLSRGQLKGILSEDHLGKCWVRAAQCGGVEQDLQPVGANVVYI